jgi:glycosyltransferase involved in cell wall biosynthesis
MTPPVVACASVWLYAKLTGAQYAIDAHSGAFVDQRWKWSLFLHVFFSRHAVVTLVTSDFLAEPLRSRGARTHIVRDVPVCFAEPTKEQLEGSFKVTFVSTFTRDEPLEAVLEAAGRLLDVQFYVTGRVKDADSDILRRAPANVTFTDFLKDSEYVGLLLASDAVMCLTTADHTMQRGAYEAVYLRKPVITSDFALLRESFPAGTVHVRNTPEDIVRGILEMKKNLPRYQNEVEQLQFDKLQQWKKLERELRLLFGTPLNPSAGSAATQET